MPTVKSPHRPVPREHKSVSNEISLSLQQSFFLRVYPSQKLSLIIVRNDSAQVLLKGSTHPLSFPASGEAEWKQAGQLNGSFERKEATRSQEVISWPAGMKTSISSSVTVVFASANGQLLNAAKEILAATSDIQLVGEARGAIEVIPLVSKRRPTLLIIDLALPPAGALPLLAQVRKRGVGGPMVLTIDEGLDERRALQVAKAGAHGYMAAEAVPAYLTEAIRTITAGKAWFSRKLAAKIVDELQRLGRVQPGMDRCVTETKVASDLEVAITHCKVLQLRKRRRSIHENKEDERCDGRKDHGK